MQKRQLEFLFTRTKWYGGLPFVAGCRHLSPDVAVFWLPPKKDLKPTEVRSKWGSQMRRGLAGSIVNKTSGTRAQAHAQASFFNGHWWIYLVVVVVERSPSIIIIIIFITAVIKVLIKAEYGCH
ncbi:unnamed protein product [Polarella glacialis]|uniref:Uncharacterized protein n=1 Tax=Polarella glacialis TaxID=89957 RepID=A0A813JTY2_POLGL|nr:unnamed protein product [Polarella glacialis]CAE8683381.1 unnamed protein product [Polarella glacialis]